MLPDYRTVDETGGSRTANVDADSHSAPHIDPASSAAVERTASVVSSVPI
jgi:hypothetical protein